jgi:hypothetical protein
MIKKAHKNVKKKPKLTDLFQQLWGPRQNLKTFLSKKQIFTNKSTQNYHNTS